MPWNQNCRPYFANLVRKMAPKCPRRDSSRRNGLKRRRRCRKPWNLMAPLHQNAIRHPLPAYNEKVLSRSLTRWNPAQKLKISAIFVKIARHASWLHLDLIAHCFLIAQILEACCCIQIWQKPTDALRLLQQEVISWEISHFIHARFMADTQRSIWYEIWLRSAYYGAKCYQTCSGATWWLPSCV